MRSTRRLGRLACTLVVAAIVGVGVAGCVVVPAPGYVVAPPRPVVVAPAPPVFYGYGYYGHRSWR